MYNINHTTPIPHTHNTSRQGVRECTIYPDTFKTTRFLSTNALLLQKCVTHSKRHLDATNPLAKRIACLRVDEGIAIEFPQFDVCEKVCRNSPHNEKNGDNTYIQYLTHTCIIDYQDDYKNIKKSTVLGMSRYAGKMLTTT